MYNHKSKRERLRETQKGKKRESYREGELEKEGEREGISLKYGI